MKQFSLITSFAITLVFFTMVMPAAQKVAGVVAASGPRSMSSLGPSIVSVSGRQLIVRKRNGDGTLAPPATYGIRGVDWSPATRQTIDDVEVRRLEFQAAASTDIPLMRDMNVNTVRTYMDPPLDANGMAVLDQLYSAGIMVVMTVDNGNGRRDIARVQQAVTFFKDHPAVLMWSLDNEWNIFPAVPICQIADRIQEEAALIKTLDTNHPVATSYGEIDINNQPGAHLEDTQNYVNNKCPSVDIWSLNIFRGNTFGTLFDQWALITTKPMMIGEFGTDAFRLYGLGNNPPGIEDGTMQAQWDLSEWNHLFKNLSANNPAKVALGGFVFEWNDEWWKVPPSNSQDPGGCGPPNCPNHPDAFANEEYFGIVNIDRQPRAIYSTMAAAFHPAYTPQTLTYRATSRGLTAQEFPFQNGVARLFKEGAPFYERTGGAGGGRGFNIAAINPCTGELFQPAQNFDSYSTRDNGAKLCEIVSFLDSLPNGTLVMMSVADEAGLNRFPPNDCDHLTGNNPCIEPFFQKLEQQYGSTMIRSYCYQNSWAMISIKGEGVREEQLRKPVMGNGTEASVQTTLPILTSVSPMSQVFPAGGGSNSIALTVPGGCAWTASRGSNDAWIMVTTGSGVGSGTVNYSIAANTGATLRAGTISVAGQSFVVSQAGTPVNVQVTVQTNPSGRSFTVDGSTFTTAQTFNWTPASCHTISTTTPQSGAGGTQYLWSNWSDGGAISHAITATSNTTHTANFATQYFLTMNAGSGGTVSPPSGWYNSGQNVTITAAPNANCSFTGWSGTGNGSFSGTSNPAGVTMNGPISEAASFTCGPGNVSVTVQTNPSGRSFMVDGSTFNFAQTFTWTSGSTHTVSTTSPQSGAAGTQYVWSNWSDGGAISHTVSPTINTTYTANFSTQFFLTMNAGAGGSVNPPSGWFNGGQGVTITALPNSGFSFTGWTGSGSGSFTGTSNPATVTMNGAITETAGFSGSGETLLLSETFSGGIPPTWSIINGGSGGGAASTWTSANPGVRSIAAPFSGPFAMVDSDNAGQTASQDEQLITPTINATGCGQVILEFSNQFQWFDQGLNEIADVDVSTNGGGTWTNVFRLQGANEGYPTPNTKSLNITSAIGANRSNVRIRFHYYNANFEWWWAIDNIKVRCLSAASSSPFDFDGDRRADIAVYRPSNGYWFVINSSDGHITVQPWGVPGDVYVPADYDGDGRTDIAVFRPSDSNWWIINSSTGQARLQQWGISGDIPVPADYDGDGRADIAIFRPSSGDWWIINSSNGQVKYQQWALSGDKPVPADYDGDGKADITVYRPSNGYWFVINSSDGHITVQPWGVPGDKVVPADYDGDGRIDFAVFRPSDGNWWIINSSTGQARVQQWGIAGDVPVSADYDGDGKSDIAIFRPSNGDWWIINSSNGQVKYQQWALSGDVPVPAAYVR